MPERTKLGIEITEASNFQLEKAMIKCKYITSQEAISYIRCKCNLTPVTEHNAELIRFILNTVARVV